MNQEYLDTVVGIIADDLRKGADLIVAAFDPSQERDDKGRWTSGDVVYHGSTKDFDQFDAAKVGTTTDEGWLGKGVYFSTDKRVAHYYPLAYETNVELKNPLHLKLQDFKTDKRHIVREALGLKKDASVDAVTHELINRGHDGVVLDMSPSGYHATEVMAIHNHTMSVSRKYETGNEKMWDEKAFGRPDKYRKLENFSGAIEIRAAEFMEEDVSFAIGMVGKSCAEVEAALRVAGFDLSQELTVAGGKGSGNFGHKGRKGEVGGSGEVFHGTPREHLASVLKNGLVAPKGDNVYAALKRSEAEFWAKNRGGINGAEVAVLRIQVPSKEWEKVNERYKGVTAPYRQFEHIPSSWIKEVHVGRTSVLHETKFKKLNDSQVQKLRGLEGEFEFITAVILGNISGEQRFLDEYTYQSTQINIPEPLRSKILAFDIQGERETDPHITVKYGLKAGVTSADVAKVCQGFGAVRVVLGVVDVFTASAPDVTFGRHITQQELLDASSRWAIAAQSFESIDRYPTPPPNPKIVCTGQCEGMGWIPVYLGVGDTDRSVYGPDETDPELVAAWYMADLVSKTNDGWHFVKCPACAGTGVRGLIRRVLRGCQFESEAHLRAAVFDPSQARDEHGQWTEGENTFFHGSLVDVKQLKSNNNGVVFLTPEIDAATSHATRDASHRHIPKGELKGRIYKIDHSIKDPRVISVMAFDNLTADKDFIQETKDLGHDAIVSDDGRSVAVFKPINVSKSKLIVSESALDVVKINIESPDLHRLNSLISSLPHIDTYPDYQPHITLAYVPAGQGVYYKGLTLFAGEEFTVSKIVFCDTDGNHSTIQLTPRSLSRNSETTIHEAADKHAPAIKALFIEAFKQAVKRIPRTALTRSSSLTVVTRLLEPALATLGASLEQGLEAALLACLVDGGQAGLDLLGLRINSAWEEEKHPRDEKGRFGPGNDENKDMVVDENKHLTIDDVQKHVVNISLKMGFDPTRVVVVDENPREFVVGDKKFLEAGHFSPSTGRVQLNARMLTNHDVEGVAIHEIQHAQYDHVKKVMELEHKELKGLPDEEYHTLFRRNGYPREEKLQELYDRFPASAAFGKSWGDAYLGGPGGLEETLQRKMVEENGHTEYAKSYWHPDALSKQTSTYNAPERALDETLAETVRYQNSNHWHGDTSPRPNWIRLSKDIQQAYKLVKNRKVV